MPTLAVLRKAAAVIDAIRDEFVIEGYDLDQFGFLQAHGEDFQERIAEIIQNGE